MSVAKVSEISTTSEDSFEDALKQGIKRQQDSGQYYRRLGQRDEGRR